MGAKQKRWSEELENKFLDIYYVLRKRGGKKLNSKIEAQTKAIPADQRYTDSSLKSRLALPEFVQDQLDVIDDVSLQQNKPWFNPRLGKKEVAAETLQTSEVEVLHDQPQPSPLPPNHHFMRSSVQILMEYDMALKAEVTSGLRGYILSELEIGFNQILDFLTDPANPDAGDIPKTIQEIRKRKKILVVGLYPQQFQVIARQFPKSRIQHIQADHISSSIGALSHAEHVIVMTDFVGHDSSNLAKKYARDRVINCAGMVTKLTELLSTLLEIKPVK